MGNSISSKTEIKATHYSKQEDTYSASLFEGNIKKKNDYKFYYDIIDSIGHGSFGSVFKGKEIKTNELRAIKIIDLNKIKESILIENMTEDIDTQLNNHIKGFFQEFKNMELCSKNNINSVKCFEYFCDTKNFVIIMELCDKNLSTLLAEKIKNNKGKAFTLEEIFEITKQLNNGFKIMKENKIIHRDLKLENILIKYDDKLKKSFTLKIADYGISKRLDSLSKNYVNSKVGTFIYSAPEVLEGKQYNYKCDLWSIGIILYRLIFGRSPFLGVTEIALINNIKNFDNNSLKSTGNKDLDDLIKKLLEKNPEKRLTWEQYLNHQFFKGIKIDIPEKIEKTLLNSLSNIKITEKLIKEGFFLKTKINKKEFNLIVICSEVIAEDYLERKETINVFFEDNSKDKITIKLDETQRFIKVFEEPIYIILIEILETDNVPKDKYLYPDLEYKKGYDIYDKLWLTGYSGFELKNSKYGVFPGKIESINDILFEYSLNENICIEGSPICSRDTGLIIGINLGLNIKTKKGYGFFLGYILDALNFYVINGKDKKKSENRNKIYYLTQNEQSVTKLCNKCGEIYFSLLEFNRQGDGKEVSMWAISGRSGIKKVKEGISIISGSIYTGPNEDFYTRIDHYDDESLEEIDKNNCIMMGCDGKLLNIKLEKPFPRLLD